MINAHRVESLREQLERRLAEIDQGLEASADAVRAVTLDQTSVGRLSRMDALQQQATRMGLRDAQQRERRRVQAALVRVREGRYGVCCSCEDELSLERLQADPAAPFCMDCEVEISQTNRNR